MFQYFKNASYSPEETVVVTMTTVEKQMFSLGLRLISLISGPVHKKQKQAQSPMSSLSANMKLSLIISFLWRKIP